ncbi:MAG: ABC transporter, partial [Clostridia bacterium]
LVAILILFVLLTLIIRHLTRNDLLAFITGGVMIAATAVIYFIDSSGFEGLLPSIMENLSLFERFYTFVNGVFDLTDIVYDLTVIVFFLFLTVQSLEKRRYN